MMGAAPMTAYRLFLGDLWYAMKCTSLQLRRTVVGCRGGLAA
jgi:hypothetical protein